MTSPTVLHGSVRAYRLAYDGQPYHGFQRQPDVPTVENTLLDALTALGVTEDGTTPPGYAAGGRTDASVSALAQTVAFEAPEWLSPSAFNSELPESVRVWARTDVPAEFHATHWATERHYTYFLSAHDVDESLARRAVEALSGEHDFHNLTPDDTGTERDLTVTLDPEDSFFVLQFRASGFPRQLIRRAVTLIGDVARKQRPLSFVDRVLSDEVLSGPDGVGPALAVPLVLTNISYPSIRFIDDASAARRTRELFTETSRQRAASARVADVLARAGEESS